MPADRPRPCLQPPTGPKSWHLQQRTLRGQNPAVRHPRRRPRLRRRPLPRQPSWPQTPEGSTRRRT